MHKTFGRKQILMLKILRFKIQSVAWKGKRMFNLG